jgi:3-methylcrotonyl-CoA carboxylase beta subunit
MGPQPAREQHIKRNKLLVRDRIRRLCDDNTPLLELSPLAGYQHPEKDQEAPSAGIVMAIGIINGKRCIIFGNDATVKGGTLMPLTVKKQLRGMEIAFQRRIPCIYLVDSGGAFLPLQSEIFPDKNMGGRTFFLQARMSAAGIPQMACIMGSCTAGAAYVPAMCDESVIVNRTGTVFLGGPPLVKAATGESVTAEELGGARVHCEKSGLTDYFVNDDEEGLETIRTCINVMHPGPGLHDIQTNMKRPGKIVIDSKTKYSMKDFEMGKLSLSSFARDIFFDSGQQVQEFKQRYGNDISCLYGKFSGGLTVGVITTTNSLLTSQGLLKAAHFVQLCEKRRFPLVVLISGDHQTNHVSSTSTNDILSGGAKLAMAVATCTIPRITICCGPTRGTTALLFGSRAMDPTFLFSWPRGYFISDGMEWNENDLNHEAPAISRSAKLLDDGVIEVEATREVVYDALTAALEYAPLSSTAGQGASIGDGDIKVVDVHFNVGKEQVKDLGFGVFRF